MTEQISVVIIPVEFEASETAPSLKRQGAGSKSEFNQDTEKENRTSKQLLRENSGKI